MDGAKASADGVSDVKEGHDSSGSISRAKVQQMLDSQIWKPRFQRIINPDFIPNPQIQ